MTASAPRRRREGLLVEPVGGETLVYDLERHRAHCLNPTAALVWSACDGRRDAAAIAREIAREIPEASVALVQVALVKLERAHLLAAPAGAIPRRSALRRLTFAAGLMPVVSSILVPEAAQAASCQPRRRLLRQESRLLRAAELHRRTEHPALYRSPAHQEVQLSAARGDAGGDASLNPISDL